MSISCALVYPLLPIYLMKLERYEAFDARRGDLAELDTLEFTNTPQGSRVLIYVR